MHHPNVSPQSHESGIALITALLLLVLVTIIVVSGSRNTLLQERMAGNLYDRNLAFQGAEMGLSEAISILQTASPATAPPVQSPTDPDFWIAYEGGGILDFDDAKYTQRFSDLSSSPTVVIEELDSKASLIADEPLDEPWYRITAISRGGTADAVVILHAGYRR